MKEKIGTQEQPVTKENKTKKKNAGTQVTALIFLEKSAETFEQLCIKTLELLRFKENIPPNENLGSILLSTLQFIEETYLKTMKEVPSLFGDLMDSLSTLVKLDNIDNDVKFSVVNMIIHLSDRNLRRLEPHNFVSVVCFLLEQCTLNLNHKLVVPFIKKLKKLCTCLREDSFRLVCLIEKTKVLESLLKAFECVQFCTSDAGVEIIASLVALDEELIKKFVEKFVYYKLFECTKIQAVKVGRIYYRIWENLSKEDQPNFEEEYIQRRLMECAFQLDRVNAQRRKMSLNVQGVLRGLHQSRKQARFSEVITRLYAPLLWQNLNSHNKIYRCNAAEIFMDVYPLEKSGQGKKEYSKFLRKQHNEMIKLIKDSCPIVREISIKGVCANMRYFWETFQNGTSEDILKILVTELVSDGSCADVRKSVYQGLMQLIECSEAQLVLKIILPPLGSYIHDENQSVRRAFLFMLLKIKQLNCKIKYYNIVDLENIAARLAHDTPKNRELIVHIIFSSFFNLKTPLDESFYRMCKFIKVDPNASRYLAMYSNNEQKFEDAFDFMCLVLRKLRTIIWQAIRQQENEKEEQEPSIDGGIQQSLGKKNGRLVMFNIENDENIDTTNNKENHSCNKSGTSICSELNKSILGYEHRIAHGLLDYVAMLWIIHGKTLKQKENEAILNQLYELTNKCLPISFRFFKGTPAFFGALNLSAMIPVRKVTENTSIVGVCRAMLRESTPETPSNEIHCVIHALCMWKRGEEIIELVKEWIDAAFRYEDLNESKALTRLRNAKKVKFQPATPNPASALRLLNELLSSPTDQKLIFATNTEELKDLATFLHRITVLTERRLKQISPISDVLNDEFLVNCLEMYANLFIMFDENKVEEFNFWKKFATYLKWCKGLITKGSEKWSYGGTILFDLLRVPLKQCVNVIALGKCDDVKLLEILEFTRDVLDSEHGLHLVEMSLHVIRESILYLQAQYNRQHRSDSGHSNIDLIIPEIINTILDLLTENVYSKEILGKYIKNLVDLKSNLTSILVTSLKLNPVPKSPSPSYRILYSFCISLLNILLFPITECETLTVEQNVKDLPYLGSLMASIFMSQQILGSRLLEVLGSTIENFTVNDGLKLLACSSLLYSFAFSPGKLPKQKVMEAARLTYRKILLIPANDDRLEVAMNLAHHNRTLINDRTIIDVEETTASAVKEIGQQILTKIADQLGGSLSRNV